MNAHRTYVKKGRGPVILDSCRFPYTCHNCGDRKPKGSWALWFPIHNGDKSKVHRGHLCRECYRKA